MRSKHTRRYIEATNDHAPPLRVIDKKNPQLRIINQAHTDWIKRKFVWLRANGYDTTIHDD